VTTFSAGDLLNALHAAVRGLRQARVRHALIGAWALSVWGRPRATQDLDFLVLVTEKDLAALAERLSRSGLEIDQHWVDWNPMLRGQQIRLRSGQIMIDLLRPRDAHDQMALQRRQRKRINNHFYWVVSPEDFILQKIKFGRPRDFDDAVTVFERSGRFLNRRYLWKWAGRLGVAAELTYLTTQVR
jgi:hypothetical protein